MSGATQVQLGHGVAAFNVEIPIAGTYYLVATATGLEADSAPFTVMPTVVVGGPDATLAPTTVEVSPVSDVFFYFASAASLVPNDADFCAPADTGCDAPAVQPVGTTYLHEFDAIADYAYSTSNGGAGDVSVTN